MILYLPAGQRVKAFSQSDTALMAKHFFNFQRQRCSMTLAALADRALRQWFVSACLLGLVWWWLSPARLPKAAGEMTNSVGMKLILIPAGEFEMGAAYPPYSRLFSKLVAIGWMPTWAFDALPEPENEPNTNERPQHRVRITRAFYLGAHEVTRRQYNKFLRSTGHKNATPDIRDGLLTHEYPVYQVSWNDAVLFCNWLSRHEGATYRLPTEAEWEYACRAGTTTSDHRGDAMDSLARVAESNTSGAFGDCPIRVVGRLPPNGLGLYDMQGNVSEWCADRFSEGYYAQSPTDDPPGPTTGALRVHRGGKDLDVQEKRISARRFSDWPVSKGYIGFRVVRESDGGTR